MSTTSITSGSYFIGKTLIIGTTVSGTGVSVGNGMFFNNIPMNIFDFTNTSNTHMYLQAGGPDFEHAFRYKLNGDFLETPYFGDLYFSIINRYYIYVLSFVSNTELKFNIYIYDNASSIQNTNFNYDLSEFFEFYTISIPNNTLLSSLTHFWLGKNYVNNYVNDFYNITYHKVALYNGDIFALSQANREAALLAVVTSTQTNIINNNTYTFRSLGTNFLGVVVNMFNNNTTQGYTVSGSSIILNGTGGTPGGYLNIIGSYLETAPTVPTNTPTNTPTNILGSIYATTMKVEMH